MKWVRFICCYAPVLRKEAHTLGAGAGLHLIQQQSFGRNPVKTRVYYGALELSNLYIILKPQLTEVEYAKHRIRARRHCLWMYSSTVQGRDAMV